jgi:hypothetical protein
MLFSVDTKVRGRFLRSDVSLKPLRTKRISSFRKFRLLPPKDFYDSIDPQLIFSRRALRPIWPLVGAVKAWAELIQIKRLSQYFVLVGDFARAARVLTDHDEEEGIRDDE